MRLNMHSANCEEQNATVTALSRHKWRVLLQLKHVPKVRYIWVDSQQGVALRVKLLLQGDDNDLRVLPRLLSDETGHLDTNKTNCTNIMHKSKIIVHSWTHTNFKNGHKSLLYAGTEVSFLTDKLKLFQHCCRYKCKPFMQLESYLANVRVVQGCIHLIQDEEGSRLEAERNDTNIIVANSTDTVKQQCGWNAKAAAIKNDEMM